MKKLILASIALVSFATAANAQTANSSATQTVNMNQSDAIEITFVGTGNATGAAVNLAFNNVNDYANGVTSADQQLRVRSNKNYAVAVKSNAVNFTYTGSASPVPVMPVASVLDLMISANGTGGTAVAPFSTTAYTDLTSVGRNMLTNCTKGGNQTFSVKYQAQPGFTYPAGTYTVDVVYTATQL